MAASDTPPPAYLVDAADKALQLVALLQTTESVSVSEAATALGVARSTAHRLLATLRHRDFAVQSGDRRYRAGPALRRTVTRPRSTTALVELAAPLLRRLRDEVDETVHVVVLDGTDVVFLHSEESRQPLRIGSRAGARLPARHTSGGKVLLAALPPAEVDALLGGELTPAELAALHEHLAGVRAVGHGLNQGDTEPGISAIGVPVLDDRGAAIAAVSVSVPAMRLRRARVPELVGALRRCAAELTSLAG
ncbi:IclR family transcriptional regulator [Geodermatophilus sabuli]|uniref:IclR family transcriptional regulator n=1 Tax=Geodermatophilus sabuli TaxID=1564158 RepID=A0A7K3VX37_9ACTN|nr:IclR family transcriptional regulator [Geodermatophilus sabuli]